MKSDRHGGGSRALQVRGETPTARAAVKELADPARWTSMAEWPFTGRRPELSQLRERVLDPDCQGVIVAGPAGVGKSRLAAECLRVVADDMHTVLRATATSAGAAVPFAAMAPLLPGRHLNAVGAADRADLLRRSAEAITERAAGRRLYLLVDNVNVLDDVSAMLIHYLAHTNSACVLATLRAGEPAPAPITDLWKDGVIERMELAAMSPGATVAVLVAALGGPVDRASAMRLAYRSEGNMLFLRELVLEAVRAGAICYEDGIWYLTESPGVSERLVELIEARFGRLDATEWCLLELVAFGEPLRIAELRRLADPGVAARLERKGLLISHGTGDRLELRLAHPLYGDVVRNRTPALRVPEIARSLAEAVEAATAPDVEASLRVATWRLECGGARPELMLSAARTARSRYDFALAQRLSHAALDAGGGFDAELLSAQLACLRGHEREAEQRLAGLSEAASCDAERGRVAVSQLDIVGFYEGRVTEGCDIADRAAAVIQDQSWRDEIEGRRAAFLLAMDGPEAALQVSAPLLARGAQGRALVWACIISSYTLGRQGQISEALRVAARGHAVHRELPNEPMDWYPWIHLFLRCEALAHAGRFAEAEALARQQYRQGLAIGSVEAQAFFSWHLAMAVGEHGQTAMALQHAREAVAQFRALGRPQYVRESLMAVAFCAALERQAADAAAALDGVDELKLDAPPWKATELLLARAWSLVAAGDLPRAVTALRDAAARARDRGDLVGESAALHGIARLGHPRDVASRMSALAGVMEGELIRARADHVAALISHDPHGLALVSEAFEAMGAHLLAAEAASDSAVAWRASGSGRRIAAADGRAALAGRRVPRVSTPAMRAVSARAVLTASEREVCLLAAGGRSNRQVADELCLSVRTVENHLQRAYAKLGINGRSDLAQALNEHLERPSRARAT